MLALEKANDYYWSCHPWTSDEAIREWELRWELAGNVPGEPVRHRPTAEHVAEAARIARATD